MKVAILGASNNPERYSHKAQKMLAEYGHQVFPISVKEDEILGAKTYKSLSELDDVIDTVTLYLSPKHSKNIVSDILAIKPRRVIMNPGTEDSELEEQLLANGIEVEQACTLVLLRTNQFN